MPRYKHLEGSTKVKNEVLNQNYAKRSETYNEPKLALRRQTAQLKFVTEFRNKSGQACQGIRNRFEHGTAQNAC